jgi:2Fe-2S ferredoxin
MVRVTLRATDGTAHEIDANAGDSLMRAATDRGIQEIAAICGGCMTCATCHVYVDEPWAARLPSPSADEQAMLEMTAAERRATSRLSCQIVLAPELNGLSAQLPDRQY